VPTSPMAQASFATARMWLQDCLQNHKDSCPQKRTALLPSRVIDVGPADGSQSPHIHISKKGEIGNWLILSHCWGQCRRYVTNTSNFASGLRSLSYDELPPTFKDAITVTRNMDFRYLWIDSICILQGSDAEARADWLFESSRMRDYYKDCAFCIAADDASSDEEGFLNVARPVETGIPFTTTRYRSESGDPCTMYLGTDISRLSLRVNTRPILSSRGWTLQEEVLPRRTLHYTSRQLVWECQRQLVYESDMNPETWPIGGDFFSCPKRYFLVPDFGRNHILGTDAPESVKYLDHGQRWYNLVINFSFRSLTVQGDRLVAISGIAQEIQAQSGYTYWAGIWAEDAHLGLLWRMFRSGEPPESYRAPSWSWVSLDVRPYFDLYERGTKVDESKFRAEILGCEILTVDGSPHGSILSGKLKIRSLWLDFEQWRGERDILIPTHPSYTYLGLQITPSDLSSGIEPEDPNIMGAGPKWWEGVRRSRFGSGQLIVNLDQESDIFETSRGSGIGMLQIATVQDSNGLGSTIFCLLLERSVEGGSFRRIGLVEVPDLPGFVLKPWEMRHVTII
jgi:hypothetical protein